MVAYALTTTDNPFSPFTHFNEWNQFDEEHGYFTCAYLARMAYTSNALTEVEENEEIERAIDEIVKYCPRQNYIKLIRKSEKDDKRIEETVKAMAEATNRANKS